MTGIEFFWEQADVEGSGEDPLERELCDRLDALARYGRLISEAESSGRDRIAELLVRQRDREEALVRRIRAAFQLMRAKREAAQAAPPPAGPS
ncbi:MAG TPA: hypothetical protein VIL13_00725 [Longimicrobiales bacterium]|jgi:hypothetical protein